MKISRLLLLWILAVATSTLALAKSDLLNNLSSRMTALPSSKGSLIKSFSNHSQSYVYDQALAIIAFSKAGNKKQAEKLLEGLNSLQHADGSLYFSYYMNGKSPYPIEGDKRFAGALAWVALSVTHYQEAFNSKKFFRFQNKLLSYLKQELRSVKIEGHTVTALKFNPTNVKETIWAENETTALEHNLDLYAALINHSRLNPESDWKKEIAGLQGFILSMWDESRGHFWSGASLKTGAINKDEVYLDNQTWSLLALDQDLLKKLNVKSALDTNCEDLLVEHEGVIGFMDSRPARAPAAVGFVWSEGTLGQIIAMKKVEKSHQQEISCQGRSSDDFLKSISLMKQADGGVAYSTTTANPDFTTSSSVAGTAWLYFAQMGVNPFSLSKT